MNDMRVFGFWRAVWVALCIGLASPSTAQETAWVQIEARPTLSQAQDRATAYQIRLPDVQGYRLSSGWYAIALGPYSPQIAAATLARLRATGQVPGDSFVADGAGFQAQFWPPDGGAQATAPIAVTPLPDSRTTRALVAPDTETLAEARAAERLLTREERDEIQRALQWEGYYTARIDGAFGPGTRRAIESWQAANSAEVTGILRTAQRAKLIDEYRAAVARLGLAPVRDTAAGIEIVLPTALVQRSREDAPFVQYASRNGSDVEVLLISQTGDRTTLSALYDVMQKLDIVPLDGPRSLQRRSFTIVGENENFISHSFAELRDETVKGYTLIWPAGDEKQRQKALREMQASFTALPDLVLSEDSSVLDGATRRELVAGLSVRQPRTSVSGVFLDAGGRVLTALEPMQACSRITVNDDIEVTLGASDAALGLALLEPTVPLVPISVAGFEVSEPSLGTEVAVAGFSFGGVLGTPTLTFGRVEDTASLDGRSEILRLALMAETGDIGGPVLDSRGAVRGMLLPPPELATRQLPPDVRYVADADAINRFAEAANLSLSELANAEAVDAIALSARAADMTVLVRCWN